MNRIKLHVRKGRPRRGHLRELHAVPPARFSRCSRAKQRVLIEGVRMIKKHLRKSQDNPQGKIAEREGPIHISNVKVLERGERDGEGQEQERKATKRKGCQSARRPKEKDAQEE